MKYPWNKKGKEDIPEEKENINSEEDNTVWDNGDPRAILLNILKLEGYKMDSGELFNAYREASGEKNNSDIMESFKKGLDQLSEIGKIRSDSNGNIMTTQDYDREKSQATDKEEKVTDETEEIVEDSQEVMDVEEENEPNNGNTETNSDDLESIIKLKEETDSWLIEKLKNNSSNNNETELREEIKELRLRIEKLESVIKNITKAFE